MQPKVRPPINVRTMSEEEHREFTTYLTILLTADRKARNKKSTKKSSKDEKKPSNLDPKISGLFYAPWPQGQLHPTLL